jgi:dethiobiotin synthetase
VSILLVSGTGTEVGKTAVTAAVAALAVDRGSSVVVVKPAQTGVAPEEPGDLAEVARLAPGVRTVEFARYPDPLSPEAAARRAGEDGLDLTVVARQIRGLAAEADLVLVEGAGGLLVRYSADGWTLADLARVLDAPVLVVAAPGLGTLNHVALTLEVLAGRGVRFDGVVLGSWPAAPDLAVRCNLADLAVIAGRPLGGALPAGAPSAGDFLSVARHGLGPAFGGKFDAADFTLAQSEGEEA